MIKTIPLTIFLKMEFVYIVRNEKNADMGSELIEREKKGEIISRKCNTKF